MVVGHYPRELSHQLARMLLRKLSKFSYSSNLANDVAASDLALQLDCIGHPTPATHFFLQLAFHTALLMPATYAWPVLF